MLINREAILSWHPWPKARPVAAQTKAASSSASDASVSPQIAAARKKFRDQYLQKDNLGALYHYFENDFSNDTVSGTASFGVSLKENDGAKSEIAIPF
jgi:hypothetical protein